MTENLNSMDFTLDADDMAAIQAIDTEKSMFFSHQDPAMVAQFHRWTEERGSSDIVRIGTSPLTPIDYLTNLVSELQKNNIQLKMVPFENNPENARQILDNLGKDIDVVMGIYDKLTDQYYQKTQRFTVETLPFMIMKPMCWDYAIDYGIVYGQEPSDAVMRFIEIVKEHLGMASTPSEVDELKSLIQK